MASTPGVVHGKATNESIHEEIKSVAMSAQMHAEILESQIRYLSKLGCSSLGIQKVTAPLVTIIQQASGISPEHSGDSSVQSPAPPERQILQTPFKFSVKDGYIGRNYQFLVAQPDDELIVYGSIGKDKEVAVAFNPRNDRVGLIPTACFRSGEPQAVLDSEVCMAPTRKALKDTKEVGELTWEAGDYIRICKWVDENRYRGVGFNMATMEIGPFLVSTSLKKVSPLEWEERKGERIQRRATGNSLMTLV